jgi:hypothetical protein
MSDWRERARAIRAAEDERGTSEAAAVPCARGSDELLARQTTFAKQLLLDVLIPVLGEFAGIVTGSAGTPALHKHDRRTYGLTCDLSAVRFAVHVFLLGSGLVRVAVFLEPSHVDPHFRDFPLTADPGAIEGWFGDCLARLYAERVPVHGPRFAGAGRVPACAG